MITGDDEDGQFAFKNRFGTKPIEELNGRFGRKSAIENVTGDNESIGALFINQFKQSRQRVGLLFEQTFAVEQTT
jgi:hypothetical protein